LQGELARVRKRLHAYPELSGEEKKTMKFVADYLKKHTTAKVIYPVGKTGVLATFKGKKRGKSVMIRGDMDALPIEEKNKFKHRSKNQGVSHMCGHDGHTTILLGLSRLFEANPPDCGKVHLLFQPAEENGMGAAAVMKDKRFNRLKIDYVFALHNLPGYSKNQIVIRHNSFTANVKSLIVKFYGKTAHAAEPENGINPSLAISGLLQGSEEITNNRPEQEDFFLITPVHVTLGDKNYGISAGYGEVHLTIRSWSPKIFDEKCDLLIRKIHENARSRGLQVKTSWTQVFEANINDDQAVKMVEEAARSNKFKMTKRKYPFKWGEDFGLFTQKFKGAMFGVGSGKTCPALHNPDYDYPDDITPTCISMFYSIAQKAIRS
jgi:amidohydrolase